MIGPQDDHRKLARLFIQKMAATVLQDVAREMTTLSLAPHDLALVRQGLQRVAQKWSEHDLPG